MERLAWGHGAVPGRREVPEVRFETRELRESEMPSVVADPLPGESSDWAFIGLLAFTAVLFFRPQDQIPALAALHLAEVSALVGLTAMAAKRLARGLPVFRLTPEVVGLLAFGAVLVGTVPFSFWPGGSVNVIQNLYGKVVLITILIINSINSPRRLQHFSRLIVLSLAYLSVRAVFDYLRGVNLIEHGRVAGAVSGIFGNPNDLAMNMVSFLPFPILTAMVVSRLRRGAPSSAPGDSAPNGPAGQQAAAAAPGRRSRFRRDPGWFTSLLYAGCAGAMFLTVVFTKSRSGFLGLLAMLVVLVFYGRQLRRGFAVAAIAGGLLAIPALPSSFWDRMAGITDPAKDDTGSREARRTVMKEAWWVFLERPLTGIGAGQFQNYNPPWKKERWRQSHNLLLQVAAETGIFGITAFVFLIVVGFRAALSTRRTLTRLARAPDVQASPGVERDVRVLRLHTTALVAGLTGWFVCSLFSSIAYNWTFYYLIGLAAVARDLTRPIAARVPAAPRARAAEPMTPAPAAWARG
ncbi:MAG TPA: O-antigen ligase family protein [Vicinamibacterales bacterium]|nr:O-antigen ligase family protein [Acidobacteriota bacterium]HOC17060.1 O-antigen ligase family protein [Vicinamibacterales bacterium]